MYELLPTFLDTSFELPYSWSNTIAIWRFRLTYPSNSNPNINPERLPPPPVHIRNERKQLYISNETFFT
jgi:hypothetical protein